VNTDKFTTLADSVGQKFKRFWHRTKIFARERINMANIDDTLYRKTQISFVPFIGTNHALSGNVINDYSLNILGGYSLGVRKLEFGGVFNVVYGDVRGVQVGGTFNAVGGSVNGVQFAGIFNANRGPTSGAQFAGVFNFNWSGVKDFAGAGIFNLSMKDSRAVQLAGIGNITLGDQQSPHLAGLFNFSAGDAKSQLGGSYNFAAGNLQGWQAAGVFNFTGKNVTGAQTSGVMNFAGGNVTGVQTSGVINFAGKHLRGAQLSLVNYATTVDGAQIGLLNIADSVKGVPIGLLSIVLKGYHKFEVSADEIFYTNVAFRTGVSQFYNIITAGAKPGTFKDTETFWTFGYGVGTAPRLSRKLYLNLDVTSNQIMQGSSFESVNILNKVYLGVDFQMFKKMSITVGATLNGYITDTTKDNYWDLFTDYQPDIFYDRDFGTNHNMKMWVGGKVGLRFL
jgi:hypothetical protein